MATNDPKPMPKGRRPLQLGDSFLVGKKSTASVRYHSLRYDFKPASVEQTDEVLLQFNDSNETAVTIPKYEGGVLTDATVYKGSKKPYLKECLLIVNHDTGEVRLEQLTSNLQVKKTRGDVNVKQISELLAKKNLSTVASPKGIKLEEENLHTDAEIMSEESNSSSDSSSDSDESGEDELANQLEQKLSEEVKVEESSRFQPIQSSQARPTPVAQPLGPPPVHHHSQPHVNLQSDLHLSDSSDDD